MSNDTVLSHMVGHCKVLVSCSLWHCMHILDQGAQYLMGDSLKVFGVKFLALSQVVLLYNKENV
jgi:hypothetical protein